VTAVEARIPEREHAPVRCNKPVAFAVRRWSDPDDRGVEVDAYEIPIAWNSVVEDLPISADKPVPGACGVLSSRLGSCLHEAGRGRGRGAGEKEPGGGTCSERSASPCRPARPFTCPGHCPLLMFNRGRPCGCQRCYLRASHNTRRSPDDGNRALDSRCPGMARG